jgi:hypothetical protein
VETSGRRRSSRSGDVEERALPGRAGHASWVNPQRPAPKAVVAALYFGGGAIVCGLLLTLAILWAGVQHYNEDVDLWYADEVSLRVGLGLAIAALFGTVILLAPLRVMQRPYALRDARIVGAIWTLVGLPMPIWLFVGAMPLALSLVAGVTVLCAVGAARIAQRRMD